MKDKLPHLVPVKDIPKAEDVPLDDLIKIFKVCTQLERICIDKNGIGLSATQIGVAWKLYIVFYKDFFRYFVNCEYEGSGDKKKSIEGCLSLFNDGELRRFEVERFEKIRLRGKQLILSGVPAQLEIIDIDKELDGLYSIVHQHEIDHAKQITIDQIGREVVFW